GVAPLGFNGVEVGEAIDIFVPLMMQASVVPTWDRGLGNWRARWVTIMARLKPNMTVAQAEAGAAILYSQLLEEDFKTVKTTSETLRARFFEKKLRILPGSRGTSGLRD